MATEVLTREGMPTREGDMTIEAHGMEPIPEAARYGSVGRIFTVWFTPNLVPAAFAIGTLAAADFLQVWRPSSWAISWARSWSACLARWARRPAWPRCPWRAFRTARASSSRGC